MPNCTCGNPLREGESECDICVLERYNLAWLRATATDPDTWRKAVAEALRRAEKAKPKEGE